MTLDIELYRRDIPLPADPLINLSVIDVSPEHSSKTIVLLHGYGGQANQWKYQLDDFAFSNRTIAIDLRGHGKSDKPIGDYTMTRIVEDLTMVLDGLNVEEPTYMIGHSFGGALATEFAIAHPERISHLILIATAGEFKLHPFYRFLLSLPKSISRIIGPFIRGWLSAPPHVMHAWYHQNVAKWNGWSLFRSLNVPTTVIRGYHDVVFSQSVFDEVARAIPNADEIDIGASGHLVMLERRQAVNRVINRCLESEPRTWREERDETESDRSSLLQERPWLPHYDKDVPYTIAIPEIPLYQFLRSANTRFPRQTALLFEGKRMSYRQLQREVYQFSSALHSLGVTPGDQVMILLPNIPQMVIAYFGILEIGAVAVFSHPITDAEEIINQLRVTKAKVLITLAQFKEILERLLTETTDPTLNLSHIILTNPHEYLPILKRILANVTNQNHSSFNGEINTEISVHDFSSLLKTKDEQHPQVTVSPKNLATIQFTGGTTQIPKGVMLSHRNLVANALQTRHWMPTAMEGEEKFLCVLPFSHSYGLTAALNLPIALGSTLILKAKFEVVDILKTIQKYRPTIFPGVPNIYMSIKDFPGVRKYGIASIKACISGAAPLPVEVQEAFEKLTRGRLVEGYGLTEAGPATHANPLYGQRKIGSIGIPFPSTEACVLDLRKGKKEVKVGQIGELAVRGPQVMMGYWEDPKATHKTFTADGYLLTGDVAQMDPDGYFRIIARKVDMWYPDKPENPAFPRDVEEVLFEIPQVRDVAVVAVANQPIAFVISKDDRPRSDEIIAYCKRRLPPQLVPRFVIFVDDFPRTFIGKILRRELAKRFEQSQLNHKENSERTQ